MHHFCLVVVQKTAVDWKVMAAFQVSFLSHAFQHSSGFCMRISVWDSREPAGKGKKVVQKSVSWGWKKSLLVIYPNFQQSLLCTHMLEKSLSQFQYDHENCWGRNQELVVCKGGSRPILQESGNKKRAARKVATVVQRVERAHEEMERRAARKKSTRLFPRALLQSLMDRIQAHQWESALRVFELIRNQEWYVGETGTYIKLMAMLGKCKKPDQAAALFDQMLEDRVRPTVEVFTALISVYTQCHLLDRALSLFEDMQDFPHCEPDVYTYTSMIKACCDAGLYDKAARFLDDMRWQGVEPNTVTYNTVIHAFGKGGMLSQMEDVFAYMQTRNCTPDIWTWNTLIRSYGTHGEVTKMERCYDSLLEQGLVPDVITLNSLVSAYGKNSMYGKMLCVLSYMHRYQYSISVTTYNSVIETYGKAGLVEQMERAFRIMKAEGVKPNHLTFSSILSAYGKLGIWDKIEKVMRQVRNTDVVPDAAVYNAAISAYQRAQNFDEMEQLFKEMKEKRCMPDEITYSVMIETYRRRGMFEDAKKLQLEWEAEQSRGLT